MALEIDFFLHIEKILYITDFLLLFQRLTSDIQSNGFSFDNFSKYFFKRYIGELF